MLDIEIIRSLVSVVVMVGIAAWLIKHKEEVRYFSPRAWFRSFGAMRRRQMLKLVALVAVCVAFLFITVPFVNYAVEQLTHRPTISDPNQHPVTETWALNPMITAVLLGVAPVFEEWFFRGIVLNRMLKRGWNVPASILASSLVFGGFHMLNGGTGMFAWVPPLYAGVVFALVYMKGGLRASTPTHILYNEAIVIWSLMP